MTFLDREQSNYRGEPILLYEFRRGTMRARYASSDRDIPSDAGTFQACPISNAGFTFKGMAATDQFEITAPSNIDPAEWFAYTPPSDTVYVVMRRFHWGDPYSAIVYIGQIVSVVRQPDDTVSIKCQPSSITLRRGGLRMTWQRGCIHGLYDQNCTVDKTPFGRPGTVLSLTDAGVNVSIPWIGAVGSDARSTYGQWWWPGGIVEREVVTGTFERRLIQSLTFDSTGGTQGLLAVYGQLDGFPVGAALTLYPGCKRTSQWCDTFFNNMSNYGGFQFMPNRTPYNGDTVF